MIGLPYSISGQGDPVCRCRLLLDHAVHVCGFIIYHALYITQCVVPLQVKNKPNEGVTNVQIVHLFLPTARIRQLKQNRKEMQPKQDNQSGTATMGQAGQNSQNKTARTGLPGQNCQGRTVRTLPT
jgi:hypothetical protein